MYREKRQGLRTEPCGILTFRSIEEKEELTKEASISGRFEDNQERGRLSGHTKEAFQESISLGETFVRGILIHGAKREGRWQEQSLQEREGDRAVHGRGVGLSQGSRAHHCIRESRVWAELVGWAHVVQFNPQAHMKELCLSPY